jgi:hypothetical protein
VTHVGELGLLAFALLAQLSLGIGGGGVCRVAALLSSPPPLLLWVAAGNASRQAPFGGSLQMRGTDFWGLP